MDYPDVFVNQDILDSLTIEELRELSNLKELRKSTTAALTYFEEREGAVLSAARARTSEGGENHVD